MLLITSNNSLDTFTELLNYNGAVSSCVDGRLETDCDETMWEIGGVSITKTPIIYKTYLLEFLPPQFNVFPHKAVTSLFDDPSVKVGLSNL